MKGLTDKQRRILNFLEEFQGRRGMPPTVYEIAEHFGITAPTAHAHLRSLQTKGYIERSSKARGLTLKRSSKPKHLSLTLSIPVLGRISAGLPLLAEENVEETIQLDPSLLPYGLGDNRVFALRVRGDSMIEKGIHDNDTLLAKEECSPQIGDVVVALVDGEATVKSFYVTDGKVELRPANPRYRPQFYDLDQVAVQGKVVGLFRTF